MKVIATKQGYFGKLRNPGDEFDVPEGSKASWFEPIEQKTPTKGGTKKSEAQGAKGDDDLV